MKKSTFLLATSFLIGILLAENLDGYTIENISCRRLVHIVLILSVFFLFVSKINSTEKYKIHTFPFFSYAPFMLVAFLILLTIFYALLVPDHLYFKIKRIFHWVLLLVFFYYFTYISLNIDKSRLASLIDLSIYFVAAICVVSILDYFLIRYNYSLITLNSLGTDGQVLSRDFPYYTYHRLLGLFKEPVFFSAFSLPFLALSYYRQSFYITSIIASATFLTLSILSFLIIFILVFSVVIFGLNIKYRKTSLKFLFSLFLGVLFGSSMVFGYGETNTNLSGYFDTNKQVNSDRDERVKPSIISYINYRGKLYVIDTTINCSISSESFLGSQYCKLEAIPGRGNSIKYIASHHPVFMGKGLSSPFVELKKQQSSDLFPSVYSGFIALYFQGGILFLLIVSVFVILCIKSLITYLKTTSSDLLGFSFFLTFIIISFVYGLMLEEPTLLLVAITGIVFGYFHKVILLDRIT